MRGGIQTRTTDGVIGTSGKPVRVYGIALESGGTASVAAFYNGTGSGTAANKILDVTGTISKKVMAPDLPANGILFPAGCYVDVDGNIGAGGVSVWYEIVSLA